MFEKYSNYYYDLRYKELELRSIFTKLRQIDDLEQLVVWARKKRRSKIADHYLYLLQTTENALYWQTRNQRWLLFFCECCREVYRQLVPAPKVYRAGSAARYGQVSMANQ